MSRSSIVTGAGFLLAGAALLSSCGDVTSELITRADAGAGCQQDSECPAQKPRCDVDSDRCVECLESGDCQAGQVCALPAATCVPGCDADSDCPSSAPVCEVPTGLCRGCAMDAECPDPTPRCKPDTGRCVECTVATVATDCPIVDDPLVCDDAGRCVECTPSLSLCAGGETCNTTLGECGIRCSDADVCPMDEPICDPTMGYCVECQNASQCDSGELCVRSECVDAL